MKDTDQRLKTAVITGAGSGVGAAIALALAAEGWRTALVGRRGELLEAVAAQMADAVGCPCDIGGAEAVAALGPLILAELGGVEVLVNAAGTNVPRRSFETLSLEDYH